MSLRNCKVLQTVKSGWTKKKASRRLSGVTARKKKKKNGTMTQSEDNDLYSEKQCSCMWIQNTVFLIQDVR
jgi:hypothetical protein